MSCKVCGEEHGSRVCDEIDAMNKAIRKEDGEREYRLQSKAQWEHMSRCAILHDYGDPADWDGVTIQEWPR